ncbi:PLP-dependent transferase [Hesseltinella vesiculosa]|uniref:PLP-dependent transferase n=1 Tax=Hesseltinella vesiculosa TaxID=101127 RepID=A0A1X2GVU7_9FUNG|nr:PLP-dependent transferase [Hesseltinella vesiculosa]
MANFGKSLREDFFLKDGYVPLNHGSYGSYPKQIRDKLHHYQMVAEQNPDRFYRREMFPLLDKNRKSVAKLLNCDADDLVFVTNATAGTNSVVRSLMTEEGAQLICFSTAYNAVERTLAYVEDKYKVKLITVELNYPMSNDAILAKLEATLQANPGPIKLAVMDAITSVPGVVFPYERVCALLRERGILSLVDGAHAIGQIPVNLRETDPDFFVTNCHKWLFTPRGAAILYVRRDQQYTIHPALINASYKHHTKPNDTSSTFQSEFSWPGTSDFSPYLCIDDALSFRESLGGEQAIQDYCHRLAIEGGHAVAEILGTEVLENEDKSLTACMSNVRLPFNPSSQVSESDMTNMIIDKLLYEENCMAAPYYHHGQWFARLSAQIYTGLDDFKYVGHALLKVCKSLEQ